MNGTQTGKPATLNATKLLIGEGIEDIRFLGAFLKHLGLLDVQVEDYNGKDKSGQYLKALRLRPGFANVKRLGITRDADGGPLGAKDSVEHAVLAAGFPSDLQIAVFVMPGPGKDGALEDLCLQTIEGKPVIKCMEQYFSCVTSATAMTFSPGVARAKAYGRARFGQAHRPVQGAP
jgi:hypothetical protein